MATELKLPELGDNVASAVVVGVLVKEGDRLEAGQPFLELETDKAVMEVPAPAGGTVAKVLVKPGDEVKSGQVVVMLGDSASAAAPAPAKGEPEEPKPAAPAPQPAPQPASTPAKPPSPQPAPVQPTGTRRLIPAAPSVRRLARELGVDLLQVVGSGPAYRISEADVRRYAEGGVAPAAPVALPAPTLPDFSKFGPTRREAMSGVRRATVRSMSQAWSTIPMVTHFDQADVSEIEALRKKYGPRAEKRGGKLTMTAILLKVAAAALKAFPKFNASIDTLSNEIVFKEYVHIGVAVDTPTGLLVPVIRDVDKKGVIALAVELGEIAAKARDRKLTPEEMQGASFTISNLGGIGGSGFTPIVNWPEVAIMGVSRSEMRPVWNAEKGAFEPRLVMPFSLSYDHRLIDGADAARFCRFVAEMLEDPFLLGLEG
ncbi:MULTISPECIES: 2-oxo acid dehydrogenase subunit E2 [unclassified Meiothermus]|uniref:2-oxo acid dehydrogenase subunit E2 n=1 Tax=unclassified Meiothermus TaxID=370471 RepID=UPI000D7C2E02|nr:MULTISPECIES: 2-oxo acid dehydrogenase subunit E2 [unclassified Meiothermus]PZA05764.1 branched-chain alpha-keto acid dehydrogenase subunit E2 [Meiothermus sp. Pnk-1]RYM32226.1 branched-chain alpha-keto acid dehydrogenase subunit E2 [Meiothermus sp. PNK-Is4]